MHEAAQQSQPKTTTKYATNAIDARTGEIGHFAYEVIDHATKRAVSTSPVFPSPSGLRTWASENGLKLDHHGSRR